MTGAADTDTDAADKGWSLSGDDRTLLQAVIAALRGLLPLAKSNPELIALATSSTRSKGQRRCRHWGTAVLLVGAQGGDEEFHEGWFVRVGIAPDGIVLDKLATTYSPEAGADRFTTSYAVLKSGGGFDGASIEAWLATERQCAGTRAHPRRGGPRVTLAPRNSRLQPVARCCYDAPGRIFASLPCLRTPDEPSLRQSARAHQSCDGPSE